MLVYFFPHFKKDGAIEAANVFVSPSHKVMFGDIFTPYPINKGYKCVEIQSNLNSSQDLKLIDVDWGAYRFQAKGIEGEILNLVLYDDIDGKWGVECWKN